MPGAGLAWYALHPIVERELMPLTFLCITTYEKGQEFMRECKRQGCRVLLLTAEKLREADWPRESLDDTFYLPAEIPLADTVKAVTHLARTQKIDRIVALDEYDMETAATLREHLRVPGMGLTTMRYFRDKLAMRMRALDRGVRVPDFVPVVNHEDIRYYMEHVPGPWVLKPRQEASAIGIKKIHATDELWHVLEQLGDKQSSFLLERFVPGEVYHVDSVVSEREVVFANVSKYGKPPMNTAQGGGVFTTFTIPRSGTEDSSLRQINRDLSAALGLVRGVAHAEFIQAQANGHFYFLECAARVGGAYINEMVEAATGINLWREWARIEIAGEDGSYRLPPAG
jgi:biotin carboxylase